MKKVVLSIFALMIGFQFVLAETIYPISREMGSGTRSAFVEIFGIQKEINGKKVDATSKKAEVTNSTDVMMTTIANSKNAIAYISLGSLNPTIKALKIDGITPNIENINNKSYKISRPFNIITKDTNPLIEDFLSYSISAKEVIEKAGYIATKSTKFSSKKPSGKIVIAGSSSITPLMEKLVESYKNINPNVSIEIQQSDSTTGINSVLEGIADIGMVSRELKSAEINKGIKVQVLAIDGLAVIVNKANTIDNLSKDAIKAIYTGEITNWDKLK